MPKGKVVIDKEKCKGCELCIAACPKKVLGLSGDFNTKGYRYSTPLHPEDCIGCGFCAMMCPDVAIEVYREE
ncbi:MAG TPA: 4Fe-4S dicluster domain-containing protein [Candidatus Mcinerneyibacteriales bacterium]|nr:4Fe-4S dicluster domain-containing protein [Candidatus Mcinerneyibacteriales bacterium]HPE19957.1 4Fe-4S dicluster domain-containing protein [Candidatus Mcinerneyibacteriales bacterium]HPJ70452.1 4Fe-4S dicluster domain-containing protein [Candidatus Mcinerneyibacteriales bacterium]HPQ89388.1 4Fe-4S dicluster domain-containing protein [Candidatus Mcinerneyibacteriales bacterium]